MASKETAHDIQKVSYLCGNCNQTRTLLIDKDVHLQRRELEINGLASYIDVHANKDGTSRHGIKIFVDKNFHVRTNNVLKIKDQSKAQSAIPMPGFKTKNITTKFEWDSWQKLELEVRTENLKFVLENEQGLDEPGNEIVASSELGSVVLTLETVNKDTPVQIVEYITEWMSSFCNSVELASALHVDLIPEVLRYIDHHIHREITYSDKQIISILIDKSSILIPDKETMQMISKYGPAMALIGLNPERLSAIAAKLAEFDKFSMIDIQKILESEIDRDAELEEEFVILSLYYLLSLDAFDYKLSYLQSQQKA